MKNFGKNFIITSLIVLAIYQTGELWFGGFSNYSFFSYIKNSQASSDDNITNTIDRLVINIGDNKIVCHNNGIYDNEYKKIFDKAITQAVTKGDVISRAEPIKWEDILKNRAIIYEYKYELTASDFISMASVKGDNAQRIEPYDTIIIMPRVDSSYMSVIFYSSKAKLGTIFELKDNAIISTAYAESSKFSQEEQDIYYISSVQNGFDIFTNNNFIPQWQDDSYTYPAVMPSPMLPDASYVEKNASYFFDNTVGKSMVKEDGVYTISDDTVVVKYLDNGVFEYSNYKPTPVIKGNFASNYSAAIDLISRDSFVTNDYYLDSYTLANNQYTFRFNYRLKDLPIFLSDEIKQNTNMNALIEITTANNRVNKYKKYSYRFITSSKDSLVANVDFVSAIDLLYSTLYSNTNQARIDNITLCYIAEATNNFGLDWLITMDDKEYMVSTKRAGD